MSELLLTTRVSDRRIEVDLQSADADVEVALGADRTLWFEMQDPSARFRPRDKGFAITALLPFAMHRGLDIRVHAPVPLATLRNLEELQDAWCGLRPDLYRRVQIHAPVAQESFLTRRRPAGSVMAFSGGLDATYTLAANATGALGVRTSRIAGAVMIHGFDIPLTHGDAFAEALHDARQITDRFDVPLWSVVTNWRDFSPHWETNFMVGLAATLALFAADHGEAIASSGEPYGSETTGWGSHSSTDRLLSAERFPFTVVGMGASRADKARMVARIPELLPHIRVCWAGPMTGRNCGVCEKCRRTALQFLAHGVTAVGGFAAPTPEEVAEMRVGNSAQLMSLMDLVNDPADLPTAHLQALREVVGAETIRLGAPAPVWGQL